MSKKIVIAGGSGFLGRVLSDWFDKLGDEVVVLSRSPKQDQSSPGKTVVWDGHRLSGGWVTELRDADVLINLAGRSVNCRYHKENRREIVKSRVDSTHILGKALLTYGYRPELWLNMSTATIYAHTYGPPHGESSTNYKATPAAKDRFSVKVAQKWEDAFNQIELPHTRKVIMRTSLVLGAEPGGVYEVLRRLALFYLGGQMGDGRQYISWIHAYDFCRAIDHIRSDPSLDGIFNLAAPNPIPNAEAMASLRRIANRSFGLSASEWMLEVGAWMMRTETELILKSRRVVSDRLREDGFRFYFSNFDLAVNDIEATLNECQPLKNR